MEHTRKSLLAPELRELLQEGSPDDLRAVLAEIHPNDAAQQLAGLEPLEVAQVLAQIDVLLARDLFSYFDVDTQEAILVGSPSDLVKRLLAALSSDDRAELMDRVDEEVRDRLFPLLTRVAREDLLRREKFEPDQVGSLMSTEYCVLDRAMRVHEAIESVRRQAPSRETIYYSYVVDQDGRLLGFLSLRDLIMARSHQTVGDIMKAKDVVSVSVHDDQARAAELIREYDLLALPVVDDNGRLVGLVTHDDAADIVEEEQTETVERTAGVIGETEADTYLEETVVSHLRRRSPLIVALAVFWYVTATVIKGFESVLQSQSTTLSVLLPMVMATGGMVGTQASSLIIHALALGRIPPRALPQVLWKEVRVSGVLGLLLGGVAFAQAWMLGGSGELAGVLRVAEAIAAAMVAHVLSAATVGVSVPMLVKAVRGDPALFSTPTVTALADLSGAAIYLLVATALLS